MHEWVTKLKCLSIYSTKFWWKIANNLNVFVHLSTYPLMYVSKRKINEISFSLMYVVFYNFWSYYLCLFWIISVFLRGLQIFEGHLKFTNLIQFKLRCPDFLFHSVIVMIRVSTQFLVWFSCRICYWIMFQLMRFIANLFFFCC